MPDPLPPVPEPIDPRLEASPDFTRRVLLGLFIVGQIYFLVSTNVLTMIQGVREELPSHMHPPIQRALPDWVEERGHTHELFNNVLALNHAWEQLTGQLQRWQLFASIGRQCVFPALELRWDDESEMAAEAVPIQLGRRLILSDNEPADVNHFFRLGLYRIRKLESGVVDYLRPYEEETEEDTKRRLKKRIAEFVEENRVLLVEYMKFRLKELQEREPGLQDHPPRHMILIMRRFQILEPKDHPEFLTGPHSVPLARLERGLDWKTPGPLGPYDPETDSFPSLAE